MKLLFLYLLFLITLCAGPLKIDWIILGELI
jgi:hypothetical protein